MKVLFTNAGRRTYMVQFALDLERSGYPVEVHVSDCNRWSAAFHVASKSISHLLPPVMPDQSSYIRALLELVRTEGFKVVLPLSDFDPPILSLHKDDFAACGCKIIISGHETIMRCNDKQANTQFCQYNGIPTPKSFFELQSFDNAFPVIQKHILGSGSSGLKLIQDSSALNDFVHGRDMLQAYIAGDEFGMDILNDLNGQFVSLCVKRKISMRSGETDVAIVVHDDALHGLGKLISETFRHIGNLDCDIMRDSDGNLYCIDFNPRFGGGYPATHLAGFNYLKAIFDLVLGKSVLLPSKAKEIVVMKGISLQWCEAK